MSDEKNTNTDDGASSKRTPAESSETPKNVESKDLFTDGYTKGAAKTEAKILKELGVESFDEIKNVIKEVQEKRESEKSLVDRYTELTSKYQAASEKLNFFETAVKKEADNLFNALSEDQRKAVEETGLPLENLVPMMKQLKATEVQPKKIGTHVDPSKPKSTEQFSAVNMGLDPEYRKNRQDYIAKKLKEKMQNKESA